MAEKRSKAPLIIAGAIGVALILLVRVFLGGSSGSDQAGPSPSGSVDTTVSSDPSCTQVLVAASSEKAALLKTMAAEYDNARHTVGGTCAQVSVGQPAAGPGQLSDRTQQ